MAFSYALPFNKTTDLKSIYTNLKFNYIITMIHINTSHPVMIIFTLTNYPYIII